MFALASARNGCATLLSIRRFAPLALLPLALGCRKSGQVEVKSWYDAKPLLSSLREEERAKASSFTGQGSLSDLPLYDLELALSDDLGRLEVSEAVYFTNNYGTALDEVAFRLYANAVGDKPQLTLGSGSCSEGPSCTLSTPAPSVVVAKLAQPLKVGSRVRIAMSLSAELRVIEPGRTTMLAQGFESLERLKGGKGGGDYGLLARGDDIASLASFYAVLARFKDGKWEKTDSSTLGDLGADGISHVRAKMTLPAGAQVASSGVITQQVPARSDTTDGAGAVNDSGRVEVHVAAAFVRDFSLLVSRHFETATRKVGDVEVRSHFLPRDKAAGARVLDAAASSLAVYEKLFGRYPFADLDVVEAPLVGGAGGVEFSGLVTVASMLYRPAMSEGPMGSLLGLLGGAQEKEISAMTDSMLEFVTAHEVAHQYWPGLVGSDSRRHPWADESLAQWSAVMYFRDRYGPERAKLESDRQVLANYHTMRLLDLADAKVDQPVDAFQSELTYAGLVYGKGPYFFRELEKAVGQKAFSDGLRAHVSRHRFRTAPPRALVEELAKGERSEKVRALAKRWLDETHGDEDLGKPDIRQMLAGFLGEETVKNMGPELDMAMKLMLKLLRPDGGSVGVTDLLDLLAPKTK